jgi:hypothetical protein
MKNLGEQQQQQWRAAREKVFSSRQLTRFHNPIHESRKEKLITRRLCRENFMISASIEALIRFRVSFFCASSLSLDGIN